MRLSKCLKISGLSMVLVLLGFSMALAFSASASLERTRISLGETVRLTISTADRVSDLDADTSVIEDFDVLSRSSSSMTQIINGSMTVNISLVIELSPKKSGRLKIPAIKVTGDGDSAMTKPLEIEVAEDSSSSSQGASSEEGVFAESRLSKDVIYMGESVLYTFYLYFREQISSPNLNLPDFRDFSATEIKSPQSYTKTINGVPYNVLEKNVLLTPQKKGRFTFDPALLVYGANSGVRRDFFGFPEAIVQKRSLRTKANTIEVKSLPPVPSGLDYSGFVGDLSVRMTMEQKELKTGDSGTLVIEFEGKGGRVGDIGTPQIKLPDSFKVYPDEPELKEETGQNGFSGKKTFRMALVPTKPGDFRIEPLKEAFFDSSKGEYRTIETEPVDIKVTQGERSQASSPENTGGTKSADMRKSPEVSQNDIFHIKTSLDALKDESFIPFRWFAFFFIAPVFMYFASLYASKLMGKRASIPARLKAESQEALKKARAVNDPSEFLVLLHRAISCAVASRCGCAHESLTSVDMAKRLEEKSFDPDFINEFRRLFEEIEMLRFGGMSLSKEKMDAIINSAESLLRKVI